MLSSYISRLIETRKKYIFMQEIWGRLITPTVITPTVISPTVITPTLINTPTMHPGLYHHILSNRNSKQL